MEDNRYIKERVSAQIDWYSYKSQHLKVISTILDVITFLSLAIIPLIINLDNTFYKSTIAILPILGLSAFTISKLFNFQSKWVDYRITAEILKKELFLFESKFDKYSNESNRFQNFVQNIESIISRENTAWIGLIDRKSSVKNLYIIGNFIDSDEYSLIADLLKNQSEFNFRDYTVIIQESINESILKEQIKNQIIKSDLVIITSNTFIKKSKWAEFELKETLQQGIPLVVIKSHGSENVPLELSNMTNMIVNWNTRSIIDAISRIDKTTHD